jgi:hypothetical protein
VVEEESDNQTELDEIYDDMTAAQRKDYDRIQQDKRIEDGED